jgi:hypothetical protein
VGEREFVDEVIEGRAEIMEAIPDDETKLLRDGFREFEVDELLAALSVEMTNVSVRFFLSPLTNLRLKSVQVIEARSNLSSWLNCSLMRPADTMEALWQSSESGSPEKASRARRRRRAWRYPYPSKKRTSWACNSDRIYFAIRHAIWSSYPLPCSHRSFYADDSCRANAASIASAVARPIEGIQWE